jgi:hypothetical protein
MNTWPHTQETERQIICLKCGGVWSTREKIVSEIKITDRALEKYRERSQMYQDYIKNNPEEQERLFNDDDLKDKNS